MSAIPGARAPVNPFPVRLYFVMLGGVFLWCLTILLAPLLSASGWSGPAEVLYTFFHRICHQLEARSFHIAGEPLAVCGRCAAIYAGFLAGAMAFPFIRRGCPTELPPRGLLIVALVPMVLDVGLGLTGMHESGFATRAISGSIAGIVLSFFILPAALGAVQQLAAARRHTTLTTTSEGLSDA
jgi:uncharacterized membrane protein